MNDLQLGLIALGGVAVASVFAYNKWQERRHRQLAEQVLQRDHADVLLDEAEDVPLPRAEREPLPVQAPAMTADTAACAESDRREPVLGQPEDVWPDDDGQPVALPAMPADAIEEVTAADPAVLPVRPASVPSAEGTAEHLVSPAIDYVAAFELVEPISGYQILHSQRDLLDRLGKPVGWAGCNDRSGRWERVSEEGDYRRLRIGLQLADRRGPLGEADLLTFHGAMQNLADELMAVADMPTRDGTLDAAIVLDQFCAGVDIQIGINLISKGSPFAGTKVRALAEAAGMVLDASGRFVRSDDEGNVLYTLASQESTPFTPDAMKTLSTHGLVFLLDVPRVSHGDRVFAQMLDLARRMADALGGMLVDDNRRPLTEAMLDPFRRQIGQYQAQLAAKGLPAGGALAQRLFS